MFLIPVRYHDGNYSEQLDYLLFRHDEETKAKIYDENGNRRLRPVLWMDGIRCIPSLFPVMAQDLNQKYRKDKDSGECNMMQFIISYCPEDVRRGFLDLRHAHELSMEWAHRCLSGVIGVAVTHDDGDRHSGNVHTHIIICTVKISNEISVYMKCPEKRKEGRIFNPSYRTWIEFREILVEIARREGLHVAYQDQKPMDRVSSAEYRIRLEGQKKLDEENRTIIAEGGIPETIVFRTEKQKYRDAIRDAVARSRNIPEFHNLMKKEYGILVTETDGKWRFDREEKKGFAGSTLGRRYSKEEIRAELEKNRENPTRIDLYLLNKKQKEEEQKNYRIRNSLQGYREALSPPYRDDLAGDIGRAVYDQGMALSDKSEQVAFFRPFAEAIWWIGGETMTLDNQIFRGDTFSFFIVDWEYKIKEYRSILRKEETFLFHQTILRDYGHFREEFLVSDQPQKFRREHWMELRLLEEAEQVLAETTPKTQKEREDSVQKARKDLRWAQERLNHYCHQQEQLKKVESVLEPIRPKLEEFQMERRVRQREKSKAREEKHLIPMDYER